MKGTPIRSFAANQTERSACGRALVDLGHTVSRSAVRRILKQNGIEPAPARRKRLRSSIRWLPVLGGLVRVQNKQQQFLWVHPRFEKE